MNAREVFSEMLERHVLFPDDLNAAQDLHRLCGILWNDKAAMRDDDRHSVRDAIGNWVEADAWEAKGRTFAGAARLIRPVLEVEIERLTRAA